MEPQVTTKQVGIVDLTKLQSYLTSQQQQTPRDAMQVSATQLHASVMSIVTIPRRTNIAASLPSLEDATLKDAHTTKYLLLLNLFSLAGYNVVAKEYEMLSTRGKDLS